MVKILIIVMFLIVNAGCTESAKVEVDSSAELLKPQEIYSPFAWKWVKTYGDSLESVEHYNIAFSNRLLMEHVRIIGELDKRIEKLESTGISHKETQ